MPKIKGPDFLFIFNFSFILSQYLKIVIQCFIRKKKIHLTCLSYPETATTFDTKIHNFLLMLKSNSGSLRPDFTSQLELKLTSLWFILS